MMYVYGQGRKKLTPYKEARVMHVLLLRCEGLTLREIAPRLGLCQTQISIMAYQAAVKLSWAARKCRWTVT
jgi:transcriptional regulator